ncbi:hypothetical protein B0T19DRAFT_241401, partial [Cercophora scortea]
RFTCAWSICITKTRKLIEPTAIAWTHYSKLAAQTRNRTMILPLAALALLAAPSSTRHLRPRSDNCPTVPNWAVQSFSVTYSNVSEVPGTAGFKLTNLVTNRSEPISCPLFYNYLCMVDGTPSDATLSIRLWVNMDSVTITFNETWGCNTSQVPAPTFPSFVTGVGELKLTCPDPVADDMTCSGSDTEVVVVNGTVVTPVPDPEPETGASMT